MTPPIFPREAERLRALADYHILDSAPEQAFDDLTALAADVCGCPIALVTIVEAKRQWFKSRIGIERTETPREQSFCAHAFVEPTNLLVVPDATSDERFADNPLVSGEPHIRFYAGAPLLTREGLPVGTLCVIDRMPRARLTDQQLRVLRILGRQVSYLLELRRVSRALARAAERPPAAG
ncbi:MAG TPA: GAF domain-containing protein [Opitutaceae bacterium]|nr:GAF domain-containing protein [Opitutaceae bacterium]